MSSGYELKLTLWKGIKYLSFYGVPFVVGAYLNFHPEIASLTVGTIATMVVNYMKNANK